MSDLFARGLFARVFGLALMFSTAACVGEPTETETPVSAPVPEPAPAPAPPPTGLPEGANPALLAPQLANETAPAQFDVRFETTKGPFVVRVHRDWAPQGADRFYNLVKIGFFDGCKFFRAIDGFMVQFGISPYGAVSRKWIDQRIVDDPVKQTNTRGRITFATSGPNSRTTQLFINFGNNGNLDRGGFAPFGEVVEGMDVVDSFYKGYGEGAPAGAGPRQDLIQSQGNAYLEAKFPKLDGIVKATLVP